MGQYTKRTPTLVSIPAATSVTDWIQLDVKYDPMAERFLFGSLTTGDTIELEVAASVKDIKEGTEPTYTRVISTYTSTGFDEVITGPIPAIRFKRSGDAGDAWVMLVI